MPVKINGTSSGSVTLAAPTSGSDVTLTLPTDSIQPGLVLITSQTFSASSAASVNSCFTSAYSRYLLILDLTAYSADSDVFLRYRASGSDTASGYNQGGQYMRVDGTTGSMAVNNGGSGIFLGQTDAGSSGRTFTARIEVYFPQAASVTTHTFLSTFQLTTGVISGAYGAGLQNSNTQFDGFTFYPFTGNFTGSLAVYGYRN